MLGHVEKRSVPHGKEPLCLFFSFFSSSFFPYPRFTRKILYTYSRIRAKCITVKIPRNSIIAIFWLSVATLAGNVHAVNIKCAGVTYTHACAHTHKHTHIHTHIHMHAVHIHRAHPHTHARRACTWNSKYSSLSGTEDAWLSVRYRTLDFLSVFRHERGEWSHRLRSDKKASFAAQRTSEIFGGLRQPAVCAHV